MPRAPIRSKTSRSRLNKLESANHTPQKACRKNQPAESVVSHRLQINARTTIAATSNPTKRIMMVPTCWGCVCNGIGSLLSGRTVFMQEIPKVTCTWSRTGPGRFKSRRYERRRNRLASGREIDCPGPKQLVISEKSAVAQAVRRALPLRDIVGDHAGRFHRRLAELGIS
jgi:hypothetical protein